MVVPLPSILGVPLSETGLSLLVKYKGKEISLPYRSGPSSPISHTILDPCAASSLSTFGKSPVFRPDWGIHINNWVMHLSVALETLEKLLLPWDAVSASQCVFQDLKNFFASSLM